MINRDGEERKSAKDTFECLTPLGGPQARVRFSGALQGEGVIWDATLITLHQYAKELLGTDITSGDEADIELRQFIHIGAPNPQGRPLLVGLMVEAIDAPTIRKTMIMIRQYKRLQPGRHEFGQTYYFTAD